VNVSDAPANGEASNNTIEVVRNWGRCMDLELIGELSAKLGERRGLDFRTSSILTIFGDVNHHAGSRAAQMLRQLFDWQQSQHAKRARRGANW